MSSTQFITSIIFGAVLCVGGIGISLAEWKSATTSQRVGLISHSDMDQGQKDLLVRLVSTSSWGELKEALVAIRAELVVKKNVTKNEDAKTAFAEAADGASKLLQAVETMERRRSVIDVLSAESSTKGMSRDDGDVARIVETALRRESDRLAADEREVEEIAQAYLVVILQNVAEANEIMSDDLGGQDEGYLWGLVVTVGGVVMSLGAAVKMYFEISKLRLERNKPKSAPAA